MIKKVILGIGALAVIIGVVFNMAKAYVATPAAATDTTTPPITQTISLIDTLNSLNASTAALQRELAQLKETDAINNAILQQILEMLQTQQNQINTLLKKYEVLCL